MWPRLGLKPIPAVSPSRFVGMQECPLREVWSAAKEAPLLPGSPNSFMGTAIHRLFESVLLGEEGELAELLEREVNSVEGRLATDPVQRRWIPLSAHLPTYVDLCSKALAFATLMRLRRVADDHGHKVRRRRTGPEVWVEAREGQVRGSIDEVEVVSGRVVLRDFKTGFIAASGPSGPEAKPEYVMQLRMYAAMFAEDPEVGGGVWPERLELVSIYGQSLEVDFTEAQCTKLIDDAVSLLMTVNATIASGSADEVEHALARTGPTTCRWCLYRPGCQPYRQAASLGSEEWSADVWGGVVAKATKGNGTIAVSVRRGDVTYRIRGIPPTADPYAGVDRVAVGDFLAVFELRKTREVNTYEAGQKTAFYNLGRSHGASGRD